MNPLIIDYSTGELLSQEEAELHDGKRPWKEKKKMSLQNAAFMATYDPERAQLIRDCGTYLEFARTPDGQQRLHNANFCRQRMCAMCQWRRSMKLGVQADQIYKALTERGYKHIFATLTIKNCVGTELSGKIDELYEAASRLKRMKVYEAVKGTYRALEVTYNQEANTYHPHLHYLLTVPEDYFQAETYIRHDELMAAWRKAARLDYDPSVQIEGLHQKEGQTITSACAELTKYPVKMSEIHSSEVFQTMDYALRGRRLIQWTGIAAEVRKELKLEDIEEGNLIQIDGELPGDQEIEKIVYVWRYGCYFPYDVHAVREKEAIKTK